jgi:thiamine transport system substrate-binding protein
MALVTGACTGDTTGPDGEARRVTLVTHDSFDVSKSVLRRFERESGIEVRIVQAGDAGTVVNRAILTAGNPEGDVLFGVDDNLLQEALDAGVFTTYESPRLDAVPDAYELDPQRRVTPIDRGDVCINVDDAWFAERALDPPVSLEDLADPAYRGLLVVENPATSTPGLAFMLATVAAFGGEGWLEYWSQLRTNDVLVVDGWERAYFGEFSGAGGGSGGRPLVVSYATSPVAEVVFAEEPLDEAPTSVVTSTCYRQIEFAGILEGADHPEEAAELIDFMLSPEFQQDVPLRMFVYPVADDASLPDVFVEHSAVVEDPWSLPPATVAEERRGWVDAWTDVVLR